MFSNVVRFGGKLFLLALLAAPAWAQTEIMPDHFPDDPAPSHAALSPELQSQIQTLQSRIAGYEQQLQAKSAMVEEARQAAISAGIQGDGAGSSIDEFRRQQHELVLLTQSLKPHIVQASNALHTLQNPPVVVASARVPARKARPAVRRTATPLLLSSGRIVR